MPTFTLKNIPDSLYTQLKEAARVHHRSMNSEVLYCVERTLGTHKIDVSSVLEAAQKLRAKTVQYPLTDQELNEAKNISRP